MVIEDDADVLGMICKILHDEDQVVVEAINGNKALTLLNIETEIDLSRMNGWDRVSICTANGTHLDYGKQAAQAGKQVRVEKPIEISVERGRQLIESCENNKAHLAVIYQNRFLPDVVKMKELIAAGRPGKIFQGDVCIKWFRHGFPNGSLFFTAIT